MMEFEHAVVTAHFLADNRVDLTALDETPPDDPGSDGDAQYHRLRAISKVARTIKRGMPAAEIYVIDGA